MGGPIQMKCLECNQEVGEFVSPHITTHHGMTYFDYVTKHKDQGVNPEIHAVKNFVKPVAAKKPENFTYEGITFQVNPNIPSTVCLPMPLNYRFPQSGELKEQTKNVMRALSKRRHIYLAGPTGTGKDALVSAVSALCRLPAIMLSIKPQTDIRSWLYSRGFDKEKTTWETGVLFRALTEGYVDDNGTRHPYIVVLTDFDRADKTQMEHLRAILDSIEGRVEGPQGKLHPVVPGTVIYATANTIGSGDTRRNRYTSSNLIDSSLMRRFPYILQFTNWMDWADEREILGLSFPSLSRKLVFQEAMGKIIGQVRTFYRKGEIQDEMSIRDVMSMYTYLTDMIDVEGDIYDEATLVSQSIKYWMNRVDDVHSQNKISSSLDSIFNSLGDLKRNK
jgi:MoxR-like ATPase